MECSRFKFRVWDNINKRYEKDLPLLDKDGDLCYQDGHKYCNGEHPEDFTIEQCTGLPDKNGKLIYEGDVVRTTANKIGAVKWVCNRCKFEVLLADNSMWLVHETQEIIGNIHERRRNDETI